MLRRTFMERTYLPFSSGATKTHCSSDGTAHTSGHQGYISFATSIYRVFTCSLQQTSISRGSRHTSSLDPRTLESAPPTSILIGGTLLTASVLRAARCDERTDTSNEDRYRANRDPHGGATRGSEGVSTNLRRRRFRTHGGDGCGGSAGTRSRSGGLANRAIPGWGRGNRSARLLRRLADRRVRDILLIGGLGGVITAGARRAGRQGIAILLDSQIAAIVVATLHSHAAVLLRTHGRLRRDIGGEFVKLSVNIRRAHGGLLVGDGVEAAVQGGLSGIDARLRVNDGLVGIDRGAGLDGSGSRGRGSGGTSLSGKLVRIDRQGDTGREPTLFCQEFARCASPEPASPHT